MFHGRRALALWVVVFAGCGQPLVDSGLDRAHAPRSGEGWVALFNGEDMSGWHGRGGVDDPVPATWGAVDGVMVNEKPPGPHGGDIVTDRTFDDFEIYYEYCVPKHGNSGMYLRGRYEIQIWDSYGREPWDDEAAMAFNGALYKVAAPAVDVTKPAGEWQSVYARMVGNTVTVVLNGTKIVDSATVDKPTGGQLDDRVGTPGPIMIQGGKTSVKFRNLYIRPLD